MLSQAASAISLVGKQKVRTINQVAHALALVHFLPSLVQFGDNYGLDAFRVHSWSSGLSRLDAPTSVRLSIVCGVSGTLASSLAAGGMANRVCTLIALPAWYVLASLNGLNTQTLGLSALWAVLSLYAIVGTSDSQIGRGRFTWRNAHGILLSAYFLGTLFSSGIQKTHNGWPTSGTMTRLLRYPDVGILRSWVVTLRDEVPAALTPFGNLLELFVLAAELCLPVLIAIPTFRSTSVVAYLIFFVLLWSILAIPPVFAGLYLVAVLAFLELPAGGVVGHQKPQLFGEKRRS